MSPDQPFPIIVPEKINSPELEAFFQSIPDGHKFSLSAQEIMTIFAALKNLDERTPSGEGGAQDNKPLTYFVNIPGMPTPANMATAVNTMPLLTVDDDRILEFIGFPYFDDAAVDAVVPTLYRWRITDRGKGQYGTGSGFTVTANHIDIISIIQPSTFSNYDFEVSLGEIGTAEVQGVVNELSPPQTIEPPSAGITQVSATRSGQPVKWIFKGPGGVYGDGGDQSTAEMFYELSDAPAQTINQDNIGRTIQVSIPGAASPENLAAAINARPLFTITDTQITHFIGYQNLGGETVPLLFRWRLKGLGKGTYGVGGAIEVTWDKIDIMSSQPAYALPDPDFELALGEIGTAEVQAVVNALSPPQIIEPPSAGTTQVSATRSGQPVKWLFKGPGGTYGAGGDVSTAAMFYELSDSPDGSAPTFVYDPITGQVAADGAPAFIISNFVPVIKQEGPASDLSTHTTNNINTFRGRLVQNAGVLKSIKVWCTQVGAINFRILSKNTAGTYNIEHFFSHTATAVGLVELTAGIHFPDGIDIVKDWVIGVHSTSSTGGIGTKSATETLMAVGGDPTGVHQALSTTTVLSLGLSFTVMYYDDKIQIERLRKKADTVIEMVPGSNLFDKTRVILNWVHDNTNGKLTVISGRGTTYKIPVKPSQLYFVGGGQVNYGIAVFFTASMQYISHAVLGSSDGAGFTTPATAAYVAINFANASASTYVNTLKLNEGSIKPYEPYVESYAVKLSAMPSGYAPGGGVEYDQSLNTDDEVEFAMVKMGGAEFDLPTSSSGLSPGRVWIDTANGNVLKIVT